MISGIGGNSSLQINHLSSIYQMKCQQVQRLEAEIRSLIRIQNEQAVQLKNTLDERYEMQKQLAISKRNQSEIKAINQQDERAMTAIGQRGTTATMRDSPLLDESVYLRCFILNDQNGLDQLLQKVTQIDDPNMRGLVAQSLFHQMQKFFEIYTFFEKLCNEAGKSTFVATFESNLKNIISCKKAILWLRIPSAGVFVSQSSSALVPETEGLLGKILREKSRIIITEPSKDPDYNVDYDGFMCIGAKSSHYMPVLDSKKELLWVIQVVDPLDPKAGTVIPPTPTDGLVLEYLGACLQRLHHGESNVDETIKKILSESTKSMLVERQVMPLLETVQLSVSRIIGCEVLQIFFADRANNKLFLLTEAANDKYAQNDVDLSSVSRVEYLVDNAGIAGVAYKTKQIINIGIAKEHIGYNATMDGEYPNGSLLSIPLINSKGHVTLVAVARQKRSGMMFTRNDELILEALSRVSSSTLNNAQSHERNIAEIKKALTNHKYYTALLAVAQELASVLDTDTLVRKVMTKAQTFISADRCSLFLVDKVRGGLWSLVAHGANQKIYVPLGEGIAGSVAATGETINIPDAYSDPRFNPSVDKKTGYLTKSILCVAIRGNDGSIVGCTQMINKLGGTEFTQTDVDLMAAFNVFCGIAISNAQLYEEATQSKKKMAAMLDIVISLSSSQAPSTFIKELLAKTQELMECKNAYLFVIDREHNMAHPLGIQGQNLGFNTRKDVVGYIANSGAEINESGGIHDKRFDNYFLDFMGIECESIVAVPVMDTSGQVVGVIEGVNKIVAPRFSEEDVNILKAFASFAGLALDRWMRKTPGEFWQQEAELSSTLTATESKMTCVPTRLLVSEPLLTTLQSPEFDVLSFPKNEQYRILIHFFGDLGLLSEFKIQLGTMLNFLMAASKEYQHVPYHNWNHAIDVIQFVYTTIKVGQLARNFSKLELLALLVAAVCHDMGHTGKSSSFNVKAQTPLSLLYKDQPVMETFHCSAAIHTMAKEGCNIVGNLSAAQMHEFWMFVIEAILATDMSQHQKIIDEASVILANGHFALSNPQNRTLLMKMILKMADLSNTVRPFDIASPWTTVLCEECFEQGDEEQRLGLGYTSSMNDRNSLDIAKSQVWFFTNISKPLVDTLVTAVPSLQIFKDNFKANLERWEDFVEKNPEGAK